MSLVDVATSSVGAGRPLLVGRRHTTASTSLPQSTAHVDAYSASASPKLQGHDDPHASPFLAPLPLSARRHSTPDGAISTSPRLLSGLSSPSILRATGECSTQAGLLRLVKVHEANARGVPYELEWDVPIDTVLRLKVLTSDAVATTPMDASFYLLSTPLQLNGLTCRLRIGNASRGPAQGSLSRGKAFEGRVVGIHLVVTDAEVSSAMSSPSLPPSAFGRSRTSVSQCCESFDTPAFAEDRDDRQSLSGILDDDAEVLQIERQSWERKVAFMVQLDPVVDVDVQYHHPLVGAEPDDAAGPNKTPSSGRPRIRRVMEASVSATNRVVGFSNTIPLRELLRSYLANSTPGGPPQVTFRLSAKFFVSHAWQDCIQRHTMLAANARRDYNLIGLKNHGATCYINVLLQTLFHVSCFRREVMRLLDGGRKSEGAKQLQRVFCELQRATTPVDSLLLLKAIGVNPSVQQDSHEFLSEFFLHRVFKRITDTFSFKVKYITSCHDVDFTSSSDETLFELSLCVGPKYPTLNLALQREFSREAIADLYDTGIPELGKQPASRQMCMASFPQVLFLHSKRFDHFSKKVHASQSIPMRIEIAHGRDYLLHAVIVHHGTGVNSGHYTVYVRISDAARLGSVTNRTPSNTSDSGGSSGYCFFHFDDEAVYPVPDQQVLDEVMGIHWACPSTSAYILVYIEADAVEELTVNFDPIPQSVLNSVYNNNASSSSVSESRRVSPIPKSPVAAPDRTSVSPVPSVVSNSSRRRSSPPPPAAEPLIPHAAQEGQQQLRAAATLATDNEALQLLVSTTASLAAAGDTSDLPRVMAARLLFPPLQATVETSRRERRVHVTVFTTRGLAAAMRHLGVVHDLLDLRYTIKYLRQQHTAQSAHAAQRDSNTSATVVSQPFLFGCDRGAISLYVPVSMTITDLQNLLQPLWEADALCTHTSATGQAWVYPATQKGQEDRSDLDWMLFQQRKNGTWRPSHQVFKHRDVQDIPATGDSPPGECLTTPQKLPDDTPTNISGSFTVRKQKELLHHLALIDAMEQPRRQPPCGDEASSRVVPVRLVDILNDADLFDNVGEASHTMELAFLCMVSDPLVRSVVQRVGTAGGTMVSVSSMTAMTVGLAAGTGVESLSARTSVISRRLTTPQQLVRPAGAPHSGAAGPENALPQFLAGDALLDPSDRDDVVVASEGSSRNSSVGSRDGLRSPQSRNDSVLLALNNPPRSTTPATGGGSVTGLMRSTSNRMHAPTPEFISARLATPQQHSVQPTSQWSDLGSLHCGNATFICFKSFSYRTKEFHFMGGLYVPLTYSLLQMVAALLYKELLDWTPYAVLGYSSTDLLQLLSPVESSDEARSDGSSSLKATICERIRVFEEVRPERIDELVQWSGTPLCHLNHGISHGDILIICYDANVAFGTASAIQQERRRGSHDDGAFSSDGKDNDESSDEEDQPRHSPSPPAALFPIHQPLRNQCTTPSLQARVPRRIVRLILNSARIQVIACTLLSTPHNDARIGDTIFIPLDLNTSNDRASFRLGGLEDTLRAAVAYVYGVVSENGNNNHDRRSSHAPHEVHGSPAGDGKGEGGDERSSMLWWTTDHVAAERVVTTAHRMAEQYHHKHQRVDQAAAHRAKVLPFRVRFLRGLVPEHVAEAQRTVESTASAAAYMCGEFSAPLTITSTLFSSLLSTVLCWGTLVYHHDQPPSSRTDGGNPHLPSTSDTLSMLPPSVASMRTPESRILGRGAPLFDVTASVASRNEALPWAEAAHVTESEMRTTRSAEPQAALVTSFVSAASAGVLNTATLRLFVDMNAATSSPSAHVHETNARVDISILWLGWCRSSALSRFRLRSVPLNASAESLYALAAQHVGILGGSYIPYDVSVLATDVASRPHFFYDFLMQLAFASVWNPTSSPPSLTTSTPFGAFRSLIPFSSLQMCREARGGQRLPWTVADVLRMLNQRVDSGNCQLCLVMLPNAPSDVNLLASKPEDPPLVEPQPWLHRIVSTKHVSCMFVVQLVRGVGVGNQRLHHPAAPPALLPAPRTKRELVAWLGVAYPALRKVMGSSSTTKETPKRSLRVMVEVHSPAAMSGLDSDIISMPDMQPLQYWLPSDALDTIRGTHGVATGPPAATNHHMSSADFFEALNTHIDDKASPADDNEHADSFAELMSRSFKFHQHLMSKSRDGLLPIPSFALKKVLVLFPARLVIVDDSA